MIAGLGSNRNHDKNREQNFKPAFISTYGYQG